MQTNFLFVFIFTPYHISINPKPKSFDCFILIENLWNTFD
ncbi:hypothetical protein HFN_2386 [Helicobacter fennelliae MRY12-0050]|uniref:Uncharacterized protein n=1 Tax=Helicobacter fennelliae MRY12-0050 TaxID=1325130 RepID=T1DV64_9HELI|nr:hypothetical protein HFN_2386 [Helicobacter fennelliae MRY12-0050]